MSFLESLKKKFYYDNDGVTDVDEATTSAAPFMRFAGHDSDSDDSWDSGDAGGDGGGDGGGGGE